MKNIRLFCVFLVAGAISILSIRASAEEKKNSPAALAEWIKQLDDDDFERREEATSRLCAAGVEAIDAVSGAAVDPGIETSTRAMSILTAWTQANDPTLSERVEGELAKLSVDPNAGNAKGLRNLMKQARAMREAAILAGLMKLGAEVTEEDYCDVLDDGELEVMTKTVLIGESWKGKPSDLTSLRRMTTSLGIRFVGAKAAEENLAQLAGAPIEFVDLTASSVDDASLQRLIELPKMRRLELTSTRVGDAGMTHIAKIKSLESLDISRTSLTEKGLSALAKSPALRRIVLTRTQIAGHRFASLADMPALQTLDVSGSNFTLDDLELLAGSKTLQSVDVQGSKITLADAEKFRKDHPDAKFDIEVSSGRNR